MQTLILLFQCHDQKGIVASVSDFIFKHEGNIITADQYSTDPEGGHFFLRVEFYNDETVHPEAVIAQEFAPIAAVFQAEWRIFNKTHMLNMGIFVSKPAHCLAELLYLVKSQELRVAVPFVASNYDGHRELVEQYGVPFYYLPVTDEDKKESELLALAHTADFLVLALYMQILSPTFLAAFGKPVINIHHSFLPSFKGANPYQQAFDRGVKVIGATAHFVTEYLDEGPIVSQMVESVSHRDSVDDLIRKGKNLEKRALAQAVHNFIDYRVMRYKNKTVVF
jgi:formyltetrahydrofolate deformylase